MGSRVKICGLVVLVKEIADGVYKFTHRNNVVTFKMSDGKPELVELRNLYYGDASTCTENQRKNCLGLMQEAVEQLNLA